MADRNEIIAEAKARYAALHAKGKQAPKGTLNRNPQSICDSSILTREALPPAWGTSLTVPRGQTLRISAVQPSQGVSVILYNADDPSERINPPDTIKIQWSAKLTRGRLLFSDMGRVLASITDDTFGGSDAIAGASTKATNEEKYGAEPLRNARDNFVLLASKHGLSKIDIGPCVSFFAPVSVDASGRFQWTGEGAKTGDYIDLRAEMNLLVFLSNTPHPLAPGAYAPGKLVLTVWKSAVAADDYCRIATEEGVRGFENTDALFAGGQP